MWQQRPVAREWLESLRAQGAFNAACKKTASGGPPGKPPQLKAGSANMARRPPGSCLHVKRFSVQRSAQGAHHINTAATCTASCVAAKGRAHPRDLLGSPPVSTAAIATITGMRKRASCPRQKNAPGGPPPPLGNKASLANMARERDLSYSRRVEAASWPGHSWRQSCPRGCRKRTICGGSWPNSGLILISRCASPMWPGDSVVISADLFRDARGNRKVGKCGCARLVLLAETIKNPDEIWLSVDEKRDGSALIDRRYIRYDRKKDCMWCSNRIGVHLHGKTSSLSYRTS